MTKSLSQRVRDSEARRIKSGAVRMPSGLLSPDAASALAELLAAGYASSKNAVIARAFEAAWLAAGALPRDFDRGEEFGGYLDAATRAAWLGWQAALAHNKPGAVHAMPSV